MIVRTLFVLVALFAATGLHAQDYEEMLADVLTSSPGKDRAERLVGLANHERLKGRYREAVEFAILGSSEAERYGLDDQLALALMELSKAHEAKGDLDNAIGACIRATMVNGTYHSGVRTSAILQLAELYLEAGHPQKALEHLQSAANSTSASRMDRSRYLHDELRVKEMILSPEALINYCQEIQPELSRSSDRILLLELLSTLASAQAKAGKHLNALETEDQVMKLAIALDRPLDAGVSANNIGELNYRMGRVEEALIAYNKGLIMVEDMPMLRLSMQINAAHAQANSGNKEAAIRMIQDAEHSARKNGYTMLMARLLRTKAAIELLQGDLTNAQKSALGALAISEEQGNFAEQAATCDMLAGIFEQRDLPMEARNYEKKARDIEQRSVALMAQAKTDHEARLLRLQRIEREQSDVLNREQRKESRMRQLALDAENREKQMALLVYEKQLDESARREAVLQKEQANRELLLAQADLEGERQKRMIQELDNNRMLQSLNLSKLEMEQKEQQRAMELLAKRNELMEVQSEALAVKQKHDNEVKRFSIILAIGAALLAIYMAWAWIVTRRKKRTITEQHEQITVINSQLEEKNQNIQSSINYAQTIQSAILPTETELRNTLPESFLLYKPLDIVSGDLPFVKRIGDKIFVAAIDCTGHGVPAAMMTFIAYYGLSELLALHPEETCGQILDRLHEHVKRTMDARGEESLYNDGFDIGLCSIELKNGSMSFAGAQLPVLLLRNNEITRIKGDILPLGDGHFVRKGGYKDHQVQLLDGDALYLFSDGIIHQFGGESGRKKLSLKKLTELLQRTGDLSLLEVKEHTEQLFLEWKGETPQTDDVLVIGLRYAA